MKWLLCEQSINVVIFMCKQIYVCVSMCECEFCLDGMNTYKVSFGDYVFGEKFPDHKSKIYQYMNVGNINLKTCLRTN